MTDNTKAVDQKVVTTEGTDPKTGIDARSGTLKAEAPAPAVSKIDAKAKEDLANFNNTRDPVEEEKRNNEAMFARDRALRNFAVDSDTSDYSKATKQLADKRTAMEDLQKQAADANAEVQKLQAVVDAMDSLNDAKSGVDLNAK